MAAEHRLGLQSAIIALKQQNSTCWARFEPRNFYDIDPWEWFSFVKQDLQEDSERGRINALSNARRAIACRADELLTLSNLSAFVSRERWGLPYKLRVLRTLDVSAPNILVDYITSKRNLLEHEYVRPSDTEQVRHVADIVELFLKASDNYVARGYVESADIEWPKNIHPKTSYKGTTTQVIDADSYSLKFNLKDEVLTITYQEHSAVTEFIKRTAEIRERKEGRGEKTSISLAIRDCRQEDIRELMKLIREKAE